MTGFKSKAAAWLPGPNRHVSEDGFWVISTLQKERESVYGTPELHHGIYRFGFRINGSGVGLVVGVADATNRLMPAADCRAWGLHLSHGALYTKRQQSTKGVLSTKQLVPSMAPESPDEDPDAMEAFGFVENVMDIEVEVDMDRRRIAFGLPGGPLVEAPVKLPARVRPWCYLWNDTDSVALDTRAAPSRKAKQARSLVQRARPDAKPPTPLRARNEPRTIVQFAGPEIPLRTGPRGPSHAELGDYLPPYAYTDRTAEDHRAAIMSARPRSPSIGMRSARHVLAAVGGRKSPPRGSPQSYYFPSPTATGEKKVGATEEGADADNPTTPAPKRKPLSESAVAKSPIALSMRSARTRAPASPRSPRGKGVTHMWDMVRYVSGVYSDVYKQI